MSGPGLDPTFLDLPYRSLGDAALSRAQALGASHADFRFERVRYQHLGVRDGVLQGAADAEDLGFAVRVIHGGAWGFAVRRGPDRRRGGPGRRDRGGRGQGRGRDDHGACGDRAGADVRRRHLGLVVRRQPARRAGGRQGGAADRLDQPAAHRRGRRPRVRVAAAGAGEQVLRRPEPAPAPPSNGSGSSPASRRWAPAPTRSTRWARSRRRSVVAGSTSPTARYDWDDEIDQVPELLAEKLKAPSVEAGSYDLVIHPSNLWLTIHESIGHATELDRALGYEANYAGTSFATYDKLGTLQYGSPVMHVTGDRTIEHGLSTVGYDDEGVQTQSWDIVRDGVLVGYQLDRADGPDEAGAQRWPLQRLRLRRLPRPHPHPADGQRVAAAGRRRPLDRGADRPGRARHLRRSATSRGRSTCSASTSSSPASGSTRSRTASSSASCATSPTRPPRPSSGARWRPSAARTPGSSTGPSTAARPNPGRWRRSATAAPTSLFRGVRILNTNEEGGQ